MISFAVEAQAQRRFKKNFVAAAEVLQIDRRHCTVWNRNQCAFVGADASRSKADVFYHTSAVAEAAHVADAENFVAKHGDAAEEILDRLLRAKAYRKTADAQSGERSAHVESQIAEYR